jgi:hypothetical protein
MHLDIRAKRMEPGTINRIIRVTTRLEAFWRKSHGWAPPAAAQLLADARLDRQVSFAHTLTDYHDPFSSDEAEARQIMGYVTLRSMCEGLLKLFFSVYWETYLKDSDAPRDKNDQSLSLEKVTFDRLIALYAKKGSADFDVFLRRVQARAGTPSTTSPTELSAPKTNSSRTSPRSSISSSRSTGDSHIPTRSTILEEHKASQSDHREADDQH